MKTIICILSIILSLASLQGCKDQCVGCGTPQPPPQVISIPTFYKTSGNVDLLNEYTPDHFKKSDLKVISRVVVNSITKDISYNDSGIDIYWDNNLNRNYFELLVPTSYGKTPIATYVQLSPTDVDTVTYTFNGTQHPYIPDQIFYNKKMVWDVANAPDNGRWPPITIIK